MNVYLKPLELDGKSKSAKIIERLDSISLGRMYQAAFKANVRLHLYFTGRTHEIIGEFSHKAQAIILKRAGRDQILDGASGFQIQADLLKLWETTFLNWSSEFERIRVEAASIAFGVMAVFHERLIIPNVEEFERSNAVTETIEDGVFSPQLSILLNAAGEHYYGDTLNLSARIWNMDRNAQDGIRTVLLNGIANGDSAWNIAQQLEQFLGANEDCPRWTSTRLYGRTKGEIASGDTTGLLRGETCDGSGVSYNALRLARTEIQKLHSLATDRILAAQPWVEKEQCHLSAAHAVADLCDDVVQGGEGARGIYDVGTIEYPLHPNCLCYKTAVLMDEKAFTSRLNGWLNGTQDWDAMNDYADTIGGDVTKSILPNAINLAVWLFGDNLEKWME
jgi:hypothetical protein